MSQAGSSTFSTPTPPVIVDQYYLAAKYNAGASNVTGNGATYQLIFNEISQEQTPAYNNSTGVFTAPVDGFYQFVVHVTFSGITSEMTSGLLNIQCFSLDNFSIWNPASSSNNVGEGSIDFSFGCFMTATQQMITSVIISGGAGNTVDIIGEVFGNHSYLTIFQTTS